MRQAQEQLWKDEKLEPSGMARVVFERALDRGRITPEYLETEREFIRDAKNLEQLRADFDRNPTPALQRRLDEAQANYDEIMTGLMKSDSEMHAQLMEAIQRTTHNADIGLKPKEALAHFEQTILEHPDDPTAHRVMGRAYMREGDFGDAVREFSEAIRLDPRDIDALKARAVANQRMGDYQAARLDAIEILAQNPDDAEALAIVKLLGDRLSPADSTGASVRVPLAAGPGLAAPSMAPDTAGGEPDEAAMLEGSGLPAKVVNVEPGRVQSDRLAKDAAHDLDMRDWQRALEDAARAVAADARNAQAFYYQSVAYLQLNQWDLAIEAADRGLEASPDDRVLLDAKATALNRAGRHTEAKLAARKVLSKVNNKDAQAWFNLAFAGAGLGADRADIVDALGRASRIDPSFEAAYKAARLAPRDKDLRYLFDAGASASTVASREVEADAGPRSADLRFWLIVLATVVGGFLMALGFLHLIAPDVSQRLYGPSGAPMKLATALVAGGEGGFDNLVAPGTFQVRRKIGSGGMGTVYEALDLSLRRRVAIKVMRSEIRDDPRERRRFVQEAWSVAALRHPGIVQIYSIEEKPELFLVFEYVEGKTLDRMLAEHGRLTFEETRPILGAVCDALQYAHASNVVHRDLKPSNIMVGVSGAVKVMDFGVARQVKDAVSRMMTNTICGTPSYMAPEIEQGIVSREADVFSLGVCLYELLSGELPFAGTGAGLLLNKMNMSYRPLSARIKDLPRGIDEVLSKALQPEPGKRYSSPGEFKAALDARAG